MQQSRIDLFCERCHQERSNRLTIRLPEETDLFYHAERLIDLVETRYKAVKVIDI